MYTLGSLTLGLAVCVCMYVRTNGHTEENDGAGAGITKRRCARNFGERPRVRERERDYRRASQMRGTDKTMTFALRWVGLDPLAFFGRA